MSTKGKKVLKKHKLLNKIWHPESKLVFKSAKEKLVIGRLEDNDFISLDEEALDACEEWGFKYDPSLVEGSDSDSEDGVDSSADASEKESDDDESEPISDSLSKPNRVSTPVPESVPESESESESVPEPEPESESESVPKQKISPLELGNLYMNECSKHHVNILQLVSDMQDAHTNLAQQFLNERACHEVTRNELAKVEAKFAAIKNLFG